VQAVIASIEIAAAISFIDMVDLILLRRCRSENRPFCISHLIFRLSNIGAGGCLKINVTGIAEEQVLYEIGRLLGVVLLLRSHRSLASQKPGAGSLYWSIKGRLEDIASECDDQFIQRKC
jgi:hypothetical protein